MKPKTKTAWVITILIVVLIIFFEGKTEWLLSHVRNLERQIEVFEEEHRVTKEKLDYIWTTFDLPNNWETLEIPVDTNVK